MLTGGQPPDAAVGAAGYSFVSATCSYSFVSANAATAAAAVRGSLSLYTKKGRVRLVATLFAKVSIFIYSFVIFFIYSFVIGSDIIISHVRDISIASHFDIIYLLNLPTRPLDNDSRARR